MQHALHPGDWPRRRDQPQRSWESTYTHLCMCSPVSSRTISLESSAYERLRAAKRPGESFTETVNRLLEDSRPSFRVLAGALTRADGDALRSAIGAMRSSEALPEQSKLRTMSGGRRGRSA